MTNITKFYEEDDVKGSVDAFIKKYDAEDLDGKADALTFYKALGEAYYLSMNAEDEDKEEYAEILQDDAEEYESLAYFIEIRDGPKICLLMKEDEFKLGEWDGDYSELADYKQNVYMEMTAETNLQIMGGNPNTDAQFFRGDLTVDGPVKLAVKTREWIYAFFEFIDREVD